MESRAGQEFLDRLLIRTGCGSLTELEIIFGIEIRLAAMEMVQGEWDERRGSGLEEQQECLRENGFSEEEIAGLDAGLVRGTLEDLFTQKGWGLTEAGTGAQIEYLAQNCQGQIIGAADELADEMGVAAVVGGRPKIL